MLPVVVMTDAELAYLAYLRAGVAGRSEPFLAGLRLGTFVDLSTLPFGQIRRVGGTQETPRHDRARMDVLIWHSNDANRMDTALVLRALSRAASNDATPHGTVTFPDDGRGEFLGPRQMPDPANPDARVVMFTHELYVR